MSPPSAYTPLLAVAIDLLRSNKTVSVPARHGSKRVLQFPIGAIEITDLRQSTAAGTAPSLTLTTPPNSTTQLNGPVIVELEKLCGTLTVGPLGIGSGGPGALLPPFPRHPHPQWCSPRSPCFCP